MPFDRKLITENLPSDLFVDGDWREPLSGDRLAVIDPATGEELTQVAMAGPEDVDRAVRSSRQALHGPWEAFTLDERAEALRSVARAIEQDVDRLAGIEALDTGKPVSQAIPRLHAAAAWFTHFADMAQRLRSNVLPASPHLHNFTLRQRLGVVAAIIPWNFPGTSFAVKVPAALAMGNTVVLKPAEDAPLLPLVLAELCHEAGLPAGVLNVIPGAGKVAGTGLVEHDGVAMVTFTGSTVAGRDIGSRAGRRLIPVSLELGGKSPNIIFEDADLDNAVPTSLFSFAQNQGQICTAGTRLLVSEKIADRFLERLVDQAKQLKTGDPLDPDTDLGAVISARQMERIEGYVREGVLSGASLVTGGSRTAVEGMPGGLFYEPTVFANVDSKAKIAQEEIFGPVLSVITFRDEEHAIELANDVSYGLAGAVWTADVGRAHRVAGAIEAGMVWVNTMHVLGPGAPVGGWKDSGLGVMGGEEQAISFTRSKAVWVNQGGLTPRFGS